MASYWPIIPGALIVLFTLRETFQDLFHPSQSGTLSDFIARRTFAVFRRFPRLLPNAGPLSVVIVIFVWVLLICFGFALIYWPLPHADFKVEGSRSAGGFWAMVYFSLEMITTLGIGDYSPQPTYLRMIAMAEAVIGFGILTASVSSIILIHSALGRQEAFARRISLFYRSGEQSRPGFIDGIAEQTLRALLFELIRVRVDLNHLPIVYYFHSPDDEASLPRALLFLLKWAGAAIGETGEDTARRASAELSTALHDLAELVAVKFLRLQKTDAKTVFEAYARDHLFEIPV